MSFNFRKFLTRRSITPILGEMALQINIGHGWETLNTAIGEYERIKAMTDYLDACEWGWKRAGEFPEAAFRITPWRPLPPLDPAAYACV